MTARHQAMRQRALLTACIATLAFSSPSRARAHDGHDDAVPIPAHSAAVPFIEAHSDLFELTGSVVHGALVLTLDHSTDNAPVTHAIIEVETGKEKGVATPDADGGYTYSSKLLTKLLSQSSANAGTLPLTFTVVDGNDTDLLAADLVLPLAGGVQTAPARPSWSDWFKPAAAAVLLAAMAALVARLALRRRQRRHHSQGN